MSYDPFTMYCGNLHEKATEKLLFQLFSQAGPVISVKIPNDRDGRPRPFAFVRFKHEVSVPYTIELMDGTPFYGRCLRLNSRTRGHQRTMSGPNPGNSDATPRSDINFPGTDPRFMNRERAMTLNEADRFNPYERFSPGDGHQRTMSGPNPRNSDASPRRDINFPGTDARFMNRGRAMTPNEADRSNPYERFSPGRFSPGDRHRGPKDKTGHLR